jgi:glyoxylase-like metal-dependent hydrolase (beta-lactamase superfamily II)
VNHVLEQSGARLAIHALDAPILSDFWGRLIFGTKSLHHYLDRTGLSAESVETILKSHYQSREIFQATQPDLVFTEGSLPDLPLEAYHVPGHCPGQVCLRLEDILFSADHVLAHVTPLQAPESITRNTGLGHYFRSLDAVRDLPDIRLALPAHEKPIEHFATRVDAIISFHQERLDKTLALCGQPINIKDIARGLFGEKRNHHVFLALLEAGAHVEYLYERGQLHIANLDEVRDEYNPIILYSRA